MAIQVSTANNIRTIIGNGFAMYKDAITGEVMLKDSNGQTELLSNLVTVGVGEQDNIARSLRIEEQSLDIYEGSTVEKLALFINDAEIVKAPTDGEYFFNIIPNTVSLTSFLSGGLGGADPCLEPDGSPYDITLYHNGEGAFPAIGDQVFEDAEGTIPYTGAVLQMANAEYLDTDGSGIRIIITCR